MGENKERGSGEVTYKLNSEEAAGKNNNVGFFDENGVNGRFQGTNL